MSERLPRLRLNLDFMPSPLPEQPGLLIRDPLGYSDTTMIVPPLLVQCLHLFDGEATDLDLRKMLVDLTGDFNVGEIVEHLVRSLGQAGFLEDETYHARRETKHREFAASPLRTASHAGAAYPHKADELRARLADYLDHRASGAPIENLIGIAAPHVSLEGGRTCYQAAYGALRQEHKDCTFLVLGTSHYGQSERFGLTRKPYVTPLGETGTDSALVDELAERAGEGVVVEDYCHAVEHSIEFQVLFLQHILGAGVRILPVLCGPFGRSLASGGAPEEDKGVSAFFSVLKDICARERSRLFWVLGIDLSHIGPRYGDGFAVQALRGRMAQVADQDRARLEMVAAGDADGFWSAVRLQEDDLRWCGASVLYTFLRCRPDARGQVLSYGQWNIDERSVVSFPAIAFTA
ncbi:MAG: AmmeMemoRadiSam system protein B [Bryobacteraceae bacterium]